jgi:hypothetical protein
VPKMLNSIKDKFNDWASASRPLLEISSEIFPPLDTNKLIRKLDVEAKAKQDGENNLPSKDSQVLTPSEQQIRTAIVEIADEYARQYQLNADAYRERYSEATRLWKMDLIANEEKLLVHDVIAEAKNKSGPIISAQKNLENSARQLGRFREQNGLTHRLPNIKDKWEQLTLVILVFITEIVISIFLLREAGDLSVMIVLVIIFVLLNSVFPIYIIGPPIRMMFYATDKLFQKLLGIVAFLFAMAMGITLNFFIAHYRAAVMGFDAVQASSLNEAFGQLSRQLDLGSDAYNSFISSFLGLPDVWSWLLVAVNLILYVFALYEGVAKDDPFPDYGRLTGDFREAEDEYNDLIEEVQEELNELRKGGVEQIDLFKNNLTNTFKMAPSLIVKHHELHALLETRIDSLHLYLQQIISQYRHENQKYRTDPVPIYFNTPVELNLKVPKYNAITEIEPDAKKLVERVQGYVDKVDAEFKLIEKKITGADSVIEKIYPLKVE